MKILRMPHLTEKTGLCRATIYALIRSGHFPRAIRITANTSGWIEAEIDSWIEARVRESRPTTEETVS